jgi:uncharacterized lipoprotein YddW (UPF0748 family)
MKHWLILLIVFLGSAIQAIGQQPKRELRGAWIATVTNIDWPSSKTLTETQQKNELVNILEQHRLAGINAVYLQIRSQCDALYSSTIEPWGDMFTGTQGVGPTTYDPLQFAITECRKRGMELHAWFNPYRAVSNFNNIGTFTSNHIAVARPDLLLAQGTLRILDPGKTEVWDKVIGTVMDVVRRYDIDGVHFDDYFYPYPPSSPTLPFNDSTTYNAFPRGFTNIFDWRRANVDSLIKRTNDSVKNAKPWVKFGVSPFGIWRNFNSSTAPLGSSTSGLQSYSDTYANSRLWIEQNWVDYLAPQLYWSIGFSAANYGVLAPWWNNNAFNRHIYTGNAAYKVNNNSDANWTNPNQIPSQVYLNRTYPKVLGAVMYNTKSVNNNPLGLRDSLRLSVFSRPSIIPAMPWKDNVAPMPPTNLTATIINGNNIQLNWVASSSASAPNQLDKARQYVVYRFATSGTNITDSSAIRIVTGADSVQFIDNNVAVGNYFYVATALDRIYNESIASNVAMVQVNTTSIANNNSIELFKLLSGSVVQSSTISFVYALNQNSNLGFTIINSNGQVMAQQNLGRQARGAHTLNQTIGNWASGQYIAILKGKRFSKQIQFIIP